MAEKTKKSKTKKEEQKTPALTNAVQEARKRKQQMFKQ